MKTTIPVLNLCKMRKRLFEQTVVSTVVICMLTTLGIAKFTERDVAKVSDQPFCTILPSSIVFMARIDTASWVGERTAYWDSRTVLRIYFYSGSLMVQRKIVEIAREWATLSQFRFDLVANLTQRPQIRISFNCPGYNSLVGKQNLDIADLRIPTMCLQGLDTMKNPELFRRTVLHEFGHVMGLLHELQSPVADIPWDTAKLYAYYERVYKWKSDSVDKWVLSPYINAEHSEFDKESIMLYAVPKEVTKENYSIPWPNKISQRDKEFIFDKYR